MSFHVFRQAIALLLFLGISVLTVPLRGMEYVEFRKDGETRKESGRIVIDAEDGIAFEARDGKYYIIAEEDIISQRSDDEPFVPYTKKEVIERLKIEFPASKGFDLVVGDHFLVVHTTSEGFARWYLNLLESLYDGYTKFWKRQGIELQEPAYPMVAVILSNQADLVRYAKTEGFTLFDKQIAYYNIKPNRVVLCDLTGLETFREEERGRAKRSEKLAFLNHPSASANIATVVHEATHLVGFSCGMHPRFSHNPFWLMEGLAVFHEVPDKRGWSITPKVSPYRMRELLQYLQTNPRDPLRTIVRSDVPFKHPVTAGDSYAMTWGLTYYLIKRRPKEYAEYLKLLQAKEPLDDDSPEIRIADFEKCFGDDWNGLFRDCVEYLLKQKY